MFKLIKVHLSYEIKRIVVCLIATSLSFLATVVSPLFFYISNLGFQEQLKSIEATIIILLVFGSIITILTTFIYLQRYPFRKFVILIIVEILYLFYIFFSMNLYKVLVFYKNIIIDVNLSLLFLVILGIPIIHLIRNIVIYLLERQELKNRFIILKTIQDIKSKVSKKQVRKQISKNSYLSEKERRFILKNMNKLLDELEKGRYPFIIKTNHYHITKRGKNLIEFVERHKKSNINVKEISLDDLEVWTESELQKLANKGK